MRSSILVLPAAIVAFVSAQVGTLIFSRIYPTSTNILQTAPTPTTGIIYSNTTSTAAVTTGYTTSVVVVGGKTTSVLDNGAGETSSFHSTVSPTASLQGSEAERSFREVGGVLLAAAMGFALVL